VTRPGRPAPELAIAQWFNTPEPLRLAGLRGTPGAVLIGRDGLILHHGFGQEEDMALGARIASALAWPPKD